MSCLHYIDRLSRKLHRQKVYGADALCLCLAADEPKDLRTSPPLFAQTKRIKNALQQMQLVTGKTGSELAKFIREKYVDPVDRDMLAIFQMLSAGGRLHSYDHASLK